MELGQKLLREKKKGRRGEIEREKEERWDGNNEIEIEALHVLREI